MFPWYHGSTKFRELPEDDRLAIQQIYGSREKQWGDNPRPRIPTTLPPKTTTTTPRSYYPDRTNSTDRNRQWEEHIQRERERERERERLHREREKERKRQEWERREWEQREKERRERQKAREQSEQERNNRRENGVRPYYTSTTTLPTPRRSGHHHNHHLKPNRNGNRTNGNKQKPETCNTSYDSVTIIRGELFIFKDRVSILNKSRS